MPVGPHTCTKILVRVAALAFGAFIIAAIVIANRGEGAAWWPFLDRIPFGDKIVHVCLFATLCFLCNLAFPGIRFRFLPRLITGITFILLILITAEELAQALIPTRTCDLLDWLADLTGLALGQTAAKGVLHFLNRESPSTNTDQAP